MGGRVKFIGPMSSSCHISRRSINLLLRCELTVSNGGRPPYWIFEIRYLNRISLTNKRYCVKFHADWSHRCGGMAVFHFFKDCGGPSS